MSGDVYFSSEKMPMRMKTAIGYYPEGATMPQALENILAIFPKDARLTHREYNSEVVGNGFVQMSFGVDESNLSLEKNSSTNHPLGQWRGVATVILSSANLAKTKDGEGLDLQTRERIKTKLVTFLSKNMKDSPQYLGVSDEGRREAISRVVDKLSENGQAMRAELVAETTKVIEGEQLGRLISGHGIHASPIVNNKRGWPR